MSKFKKFKNNLIKLFIFLCIISQCNNSLGMLGFQLACKTKSTALGKVCAKAITLLKDIDDYHSGHTLLTYACKANHFKQVKHLIKNEADTNQTNSRNHSPLYYACKNNNPKLVQLLIENDAHINSKFRLFKCSAYPKDSEFWLTPLQYACMQNHTDAAAMLLQHGADTNTQTSELDTPLDFAAENNNFRLVRLLVQNEAIIQKKHINKTNNFKIKSYLKTHLSTQNRKLAHACAAGNLEKVKNIVGRIFCLGMYTHEKIADGKTIFHIAAQNEYIDILKYLQKAGCAGADSCMRKSRDSQGKTPLDLLYQKLVFACQTGDLKKIKKIKEPFQNGLLRGRRKNKKTLLHIAIENGHLNIARYLINHFADISARDSQGKTPLDLLYQSLLHAYENRDLEKIQKFIELEQAAFDFQYKYNRKFDRRTLLHIAAENENMNIYQYLIQKGANTSAKNSQGKTPLDILYQKLFRACKIGNLEKIKAFIEQANLQVNRFMNRTTLLHVAAQHGHMKIFDYLIKQGANISTRDSNNLTPFELARDRGHINLENGVIPTFDRIPRGLEIFDAEECPICIEEYEDLKNEENPVAKITLIPCGHSVCETCYLRYPRQCSLCKTDVLGLVRN